MASFIKLVYLIILLSIAIDFISLGNFLFNTDHDATAVQSSLLLPGAEAWVGPAIRAISKSARKAAKKRAKEAARKKGNARNKAKKAGGKGTKPEITMRKPIGSWAITIIAWSKLG